ncbi:integral membrane protein [Bordetella pertussis]|nr:integral membrane protein [Bordetella pertussis]CFW40033.1 integral membrane protein [Bordetella pertussis]
MGSIVSLSLIPPGPFFVAVSPMQALWMLLASAMFAIMGSFVKLASEHGASLPQVVFSAACPRWCCC